jgi:hypothetical protein
MVGAGQEAGDNIGPVGSRYMLAATRMQSSRRDATRSSMLPPISS